MEPPNFIKITSLHNYTLFLSEFRKKLYNFEKEIKNKEYGNPKSGHDCKPH